MSFSAPFNVKEKQERKEMILLGHHIFSLCESWKKNISSVLVNI